MSPPSFFHSTQMRIILLVFCSSHFFSCAMLSKNNLQEEAIFKPFNSSYQLSENERSFGVFRESGYVSSKNEFVVKRKIVDRSSGGSELMVEKNITIASVEKIKDNVKFLRPKISQHTVWLEGQEYFSEIKFDPTVNSFFVKVVAPDTKWKPNEVVKMSDSAQVFCFYSQIIECAKIAGFIDAAIKEQTGEMNLVVVWDSFPFFSEQYDNVTEKLFIKAVFQYEDKVENGDFRFALAFEDQMIFYIIDKDSHKLKKMFWVSQGLSMGISG